MIAKELVLSIYPNATCVNHIKCFKHNQSDLNSSSWLFKYEIRDRTAFIGGSDYSEEESWNQAMNNINREMLFRLEY